VLIKWFLPYLNPLHLTPSIIHSPHCLKLHCASERSLINTKYMGQSPEKLTGPQLVKKLPTFYGTWRFITLFTRDCHLSLTSAGSIQSMPPPSHYFRRSILIVYANLCLSLQWSPLLGFPHQNPAHNSLLLHMCYMSQSSNSLCLIIRVQIIKLLIM